VPTLIRDYETRSLLDIRKVGAHRYAADPSTEVIVGAYAVGAGPVQLWVPGEPVPEAFIEASRDPSWVAVAHNDAFETAVESCILGPRFGWPLVPIERHRCTMSTALALSLPGKLELVAKALSLPHQKDVVGHRLALQMARPRRPRKGEDPTLTYWFDDAERIHRLGEYCRVDVETERDLFGQLRPLCGREQQLWTLDAEINSRGVRLDVGLAQAASQIIKAALQELDQELALLTGGQVTKASQVARLQVWVQARVNLEITSLDKENVELILADVSLPPAVRRALEIRAASAQAAAKKIDTMLAWCGADGRIRGGFKYHGAGPGRWTGSGPQLQNLKKLAEDADIPASVAAIASGDCAQVKATFPNPLELIGSTVRPMLVATPKHRLIGGDFGSIEAIVLAWLAGETWKLDAFRDQANGGPSVYAVTAWRIFGRDPKTITKKDPEREVGKRCELAFGYAGGLGAWRNFEKHGTGAPFTDAQVETFKTEWRRLHPRIVSFWSTLNAAAVEATWHANRVVECGPVAFKRQDCFLFLRLPSSRKIAYPYPRLQPTRSFDHVVVFKDNSEGQWRDCRHGQGAYGGLWCENVVQGVARDLLAEAMVRLEAASYPIVAHCHDEVLTEVPAGFGSVDQFKEIMTAMPRWAEGLPLTADVFEGDRYIK
jgi:DNA polymerase bacteriophage-type